MDLPLPYGVSVEVPSDLKADIRSGHSSAHEPAWVPRCSYERRARTSSMLSFGPRFGPTTGLSVIRGRLKGLLESPPDGLDVWRSVGIGERALPRPRLSPFAVLNFSAFLSAHQHSGRDFRLAASTSSAFVSDLMYEIVRP